MQHKDALEKKVKFALKLLEQSKSAANHILLAQCIASQEVTKVYLRGQISLLEYAIQELNCSLVDQQQLHNKRHNHA